MQQRSLGRTRLAVTPLGLGLAALGRPGYINLGHGRDLEGRRSVGALERHTHALLDAAWAAGIRYVDAARSYGRAEAFLASWLHTRHIAPEAVTVGSKWGYTYTAGWRVDAETHEVKEHTLPVFERQWAETSALLGGHVKLYQIHSATLESGVLDRAEVLAALGRLKEDGVCIGLSLSGAAQAATLRKAMAIRPDGALLFDAVQATWNLLEPSAGAALQEAHDAGLGVLVKEAVANGRLTPRNTNADFAERREVLDATAARLGTSVDALALAAALAQPWADVVLSGAATLAQLASNLRALTVPWDAEAAATLTPLAEPPGAYWTRRSQLDWN